jgi:hypothetical protein
VYFIYRENGDEIMVNVRIIPFESSMRLTDSETQALESFLKSELDLSRNNKIS